VTAGERLPSGVLFHTVIYDGFALKKSGSQDRVPIGGFSAGFLVPGRSAGRQESIKSRANSMRSMFVKGTRERVTGSWQNVAPFGRCQSQSNEADPGTTDALHLLRASPDGVCRDVLKLTGRMGLDGCRGHALAGLSRVECAMWRDGDVFSLQAVRLTKIQVHARVIAG